MSRKMKKPKEEIAGIKFTQIYAEKTKRTQIKQEIFDIRGKTKGRSSREKVLADKTRDIRD
jgi:hypothetical protein